ncbi:hypothetical protein GIB67_040179 [Kingdonia uniflora]|uniref:Uncharacterized protein n=1 Tax=Kingdonia uniflora TaxID=39325 RepID=A0A7J7MUT4_9MAGN|nr:hypothetical protein GIB67_040179 [Kingdonia uniflora]
MLTGPRFILAYPTCELAGFSHAQGTSWPNGVIMNLNHPDLEKKKNTKHDDINIVTQILVVFMKTFNKSREENAQQAEAEKKILEKEAMKEKANSSAKR